MVSDPTKARAAWPGFVTKKTAPDGLALPTARAKGRRSAYLVACAGTGHEAPATIAEPTVHCLVGAADR